MKKNLYYRTMFRRRNAFKEFVYGFFYTICSIPRLLLEVWARRNFGERYFSFSTAMVVTFILFWVPAVIVEGFSYGSGLGFWGFVLRYLSWYAFLAGFVYMCIQRKREIQRLPSVFDFGRYSLSAGEIHPVFYSIKAGNRPADIREIETIVEPGCFFLIGLTLLTFAQPVGLLIMLCAVCYSISYFATYDRGDNFIMDKIDELIINEEHVNAFIDGLPAEDSRGVRYYGRIPQDPELRKLLTDSIIVDPDVVEAR